MRIYEDLAYKTKFTLVKNKWLLLLERCDTGWLANDKCWYALGLKKQFV